MIIVQGGTTSHDPGLTILQARTPPPGRALSRKRNVPLTRFCQPVHQGMGPPNPYRMAHIPCPEGDVEQFVVHYSSPWEGGMYTSPIMAARAGPCWAGGSLGVDALFPCTQATRCRS